MYMRVSQLIEKEKVFSVMKYQYVQGFGTRWHACRKYLNIGECDQNIKQGSVMCKDQQGFLSIDN